MAKWFRSTPRPGCVEWVYAATAGVRSPLSLASIQKLRMDLRVTAAFFGDGRAFRLRFGCSHWQGNLEG